MKHLTLTLDPYEALDIVLALETRLVQIQDDIQEAIEADRTEDVEGLRFEHERAKALYVRLIAETRDQTGVAL